MKKALITGANRSIGLETARQLLQQGYHVYLGSRTLQNGEDAAAMLKAEGFAEVEAIQLDVSNEASVKAARAELGRRTDVLDVLVNNAGIMGGMGQNALTTDIAVYKEVFDTNLFGVVMVTQAFIDLLRKSDSPRIVNVTSGLGSATLHNDPSWFAYTVKAAIYNSSKSALNMYTISLAYELRDTPFKVNAVDPGYTATDFNNHSGTATVETAGARIAKYAMIGDEGPSGRFISEEHTPVTGEIPW